MQHTAQLPPELLLQGASWLARQTLDCVDSPTDERPAGVDRRLDLYAGPLGIALFWAAFARTHPDAGPEAGARCECLLEPSRRVLEAWHRAPDTFDRAGLGLGGLCGLGALVFTLASTGRLLERSEWIEEAGAAAMLMTPERITADDNFEVLFGGAGALLALLGLATVLGPGRDADTVLDRAEICGQHLLAHRTPGPDGHRGWIFQGRLLSGFSHGAAGITCALARLHAQRPSALWCEAIREGLAFERSLERHDRGWLFHAAVRNDERHLDAWCRGAPGILLGRVDALDGYDTPEIHSDIQRLLMFTRNLPPTRADDLCCGSLGRAMILHHTHRRLSKSSKDASGLGIETLPATVATIVRGVLGRAKGRGHFVWSKLANADSNPFFFQGAAGAAYALLDLAAPGALPNPLSLRPAASLSTRDASAEPT